MNYFKYDNDLNIMIIMFSGHKRNVSLRRFFYAPKQMFIRKMMKIISLYPFGGYIFLRLHPYNSNY